MSEKPLFGQSEIDSTLKKNQEFLDRMETKSVGLGVFEMSIENFEIEFDQKDGEPWLKFELVEQGSKPLKEKYKIGGPSEAARIGREQFIDLFNRAFDATLSEMKTHDDVLRFANKYNKKMLKVATKKQEILKSYKADTENGFDAEMCIGSFIKPWYYGKIGEDLSYNIKKATKPLSTKDMKAYEALVVERNGKPLRTSEEIYQSRKAIKEAKPEGTQQNSQSQTQGGSDDLPF